MSPTSSKATPRDRAQVGRAGDGTKTGGETSFDWAALVPLLVHPLRVAIIEAMVWISVPLSASDLNKALDRRFALGNISYHLRELAKIGIVKLAGRRQVRGAVERFYRLSDQALAPSPAHPQA